MTDDPDGAAEHPCMARSWGVKWYGRYLQYGLPGLRTRPRSGRPPFVSKRVMNGIWRTIKKDHLLTAKEVRDLIMETAGTGYRRRCSICVWRNIRHPTQIEQPLSILTYSVTGKV